VKYSSGINRDLTVDKEAPHYKLKVLLDEEMCECIRCEATDELAERFCVNHGSSKFSRKRLVSTLFSVPQTRLDLLPQYARFAAIVDHVFDDVAAPLVANLEAQFHGRAK
jgi:regulator of nonsense transcripts 2